MHNNLPALNALRYFEAAGRLGSFARAGDELHVTHGAISRQARQLEEDLAVLLFDRRNRRVRLTPAGQTLLDATVDAFTRVRDAVAAVRSVSAPLPLVVSCEPTLTQRWLIPRLPRLLLNSDDPAALVKAHAARIAFDAAAEILLAPSNTIPHHAPTERQIVELYH